MNQNLKDSILDLVEIQKLSKNEILLNAGEICRHIYFVEKGILRTFQINSNGSEFTRLLAGEGQFCTILMSFQVRIPSPAYDNTGKIYIGAESGINVSSSYSDIVGFQGV